MFAAAGQPEPGSLDGADTPHPTAAPGPSSDGQPEPGSPEGADPAPFEHAIHFRVSLGLRADPAYVAAVEADPSASRVLEIALTADELRQVEATQETVASILVPLTRKLEADPHFAGLYLEFAGPVLDIATTADPSTVEAALRDFRNSGVVFRVRRVSNSLLELQQLQDQVTRDWGDWMDAGVQIASVGVDVKANLLEVMIVSASSDPDSAARLTARYGRRITVVLGSKIVAGVG